VIRIAIAAALIASVLGVYAGVRTHQFLHYDDDIYVLDNPNLRRPLDASAVVDAFADPYYDNWIPLTHLSLHLDFARAGLDPAAFLITNVLLHAASSALLFYALLALGGALWTSAFAAGVFALHPLHVESVAWISERKDVLSGLFFALALLAYARSARTPAPRHRGVAAALAAGLLAKPSLVPLPFLLVVLDFWPLRRWGAASAQPLGLAALLREKRWLFLLALIASLVALRVQSAGGTMNHGDALPFDVRLPNASLSVGAYLRDAVWPSRLAAFYPHPEGDISRTGAAAMAALLVAATAACWWLRRTQPWLLVGWLWFLGLLAPVLGLVQVGAQARADRYTYLPLTGLAIALAGCAASWAGADPARRRACAGAGLALLALLAVTAQRQVAVWRDTETLFAHAAAVTEGNFLAEHAVGSELLARGEADLAEPHFAAALRMRERWPEAHLGLADAHAAQGRFEQAIREYESGLRRAPRNARGHLRLARALLATGRSAEALGRARAAVALAPPDERAEAETVLGAVLLERRAYAEAEAAYASALALSPDLGEAWVGHGMTLLAQGKLEAGYAALQRARQTGVGVPALELALGDAARMLGREGEASAHFRAARDAAHAAGDAGLAADAASRLGE